jgi:uncharacterized protein (TIGR02594 family)
MTAFNHGKFMEELRRQRGKVPADLYEDLMAALAVGLGQKPEPVPSEIAPPWLAEARRHMGMKEIPGAAHNATILGWVKKLGGWFTDDETPWCGTFVAHCVLTAGISDLPKHWYRARDWWGWGQNALPRVGAIAVFGRQGGGHVGFVVGESAHYLYVLGGNQSNMVNIAPIAKDRLLALRWPPGVPQSLIKLPAMTGGSVSRNEA